MKQKLPRWAKVLLVVMVILGVVLGSGFYTYQRFVATNQRSIGSGVLVSGSNVPANVQAAVVRAQAPLDSALATPAGSTFQVVPSGTLNSPLTLQLPLARAVPAGSKLIVMTAEAPGGPWTPLAATLSPDGKSVSVQATHLSLFEPLLLDLQAMFSDFKKQFLDALTSNLFVNAVPPTCQNQSAARSDGYSIASTTSDTLFWCFGMANSKRAITAVNNRRYVLAAQHKGLNVMHVDAPSIGLGKIAEWEDSINHEVMILPGETAQFGVDLQTGYEAGFKTEADAGAQLMYSLQTGLEALVFILTRFGEKQIAKVAGAKLLSSALDYTECGDAALAELQGKSTLGDVMAACLGTKAVEKTFPVWSIILDFVVEGTGFIAYLVSEYQGIHDILTSRDQYVVIVARSLPSPCQASAGLCLGVHSGDVDGDGRPDQVGVTYIRGACSYLGCTFTNLTIHVVLATGQSIDYLVPVCSEVVDGCQDLTNPQFLGLHDLDGNGGDEIVLTYADCVDGCGYWAFELRQGQLKLMPFYGGMASQYGLDGLAGEGARSFKCTISNGVPSVTILPGFQAPTPQYAEVYQPDGNGGMRYTSKFLVSPAEAAADGLSGVNCSGLTLTS